MKLSVYLPFYTVADLAALVVNKLRIREFDIHLRPVCEKFTIIILTLVFKMSFFLPFLTECCQFYTIYLKYPCVMFKVGSLLWLVLSYGSDTPLTSTCFGYRLWYLFVLVFNLKTWMQNSWLFDRAGDSEYLEASALVKALPHTAIAVIQSYFYTFHHQHLTSYSTHGLFSSLK